MPNSTLVKRSIIFFAVLTLSTRTFTQLPTANFTSSATSGCTPWTVHFTDQSTGNPFSWNWDFGNGQLSTLQNPAVTFYVPGTYTIKLVVKNASGIDEEIKMNYITVNPSPTASFGSNSTLGCAPTTIQFIDQSTSTPAAGPIVSWSWNFGDGGTSTNQNPSHVYTNAGYYTVSLTVTSSTGCQNTSLVGRYIKIVNGVSADFNWSEPGRCEAPFPVSFQDQSTGPGSLTYLWNFGNGAPSSTIQNPSTVYSSAGTYSVTLQVHSSLGCDGSITKNVPVTGRTTDFTAPASVCLGQNVTFQNNSSPPPLSSFWNFGDGTTSSQINPQKTYLTIGTFPVTLINNYGNCVDSVTKNITVTNQPPVNFTANDTSSCQAPFSVQFSDQSPAAASWIWNFGDGGTSTEQNPSHTYTSGGSYTVSLTITLSGGCTNTITKQQFVKIIPTTIKISNVPAGGCVPFSFSPIAQVQSVDAITNYSWNMGEPGAVYNTQFPTHTYNSVGNYNITLTVTTQNGCVVTITDTNAVRTGVPPTVNFSFLPDNVCASTAIQFTDLSDTSAGAFVVRQWRFGDGQTSTLKNPTHVYEDTGRLYPTLVVSNNGCKDSMTQPVTVLPPVAIFGSRVNCNNRLQVTFLDSSLVNPAYGPITYQWSMGDPANTVFYGPAPTFTYPSLGSYTARLIVTNGACSYQTSKEIILMNESAGIAINHNPVCKSELFTLTAIVSDTTRFTSYAWMIGNSAFPDSTRIAEWSLPAYGNYSVTLTTKDINGCSNTDTFPNFIHVGGPVPNFSVNAPGGCVNSTLIFTDHSTPAATITSWTWNYGDGTQQTYSSPPFSHTYSETGSYSVTLMIKDTANCADTLTIPNAVLITRPTAAFRADTFYCPSAPMQFVDTSSGNGLHYAWSFGDGATSTLQNPTHAYPAGDSVYTVTLNITDTVGCADSMTKTNYVHIRSPQAAFAMQDSTGICLPTVTNFTFQGQYYQGFYWDFGDGTQSTVKDPAHFYNSYGVYTPKLFLIGPGGCVDSAQGTINIYDPYAATQIAGAPQSGCHSITTTFQLSPPPGFAFRFYFGDGGIDSSQQLNLVHTYAWPGNYTPYIGIVDNYGCDAVVYGSPIHVYGALPIFSMNKKEFCDSGRVFFLNHSLTNDSIISTVWNFDDGSTDNTWEPSHIFSPPGSYYVTLTLTTEQQCTSSSKDTVRIYPTPDLIIQGKDTICLNTSERYSGVLALPDSTIKWQWTFGNGATGQTQNSSVTYSATGNYHIQLTAINKLGCTDSTALPVFVVPQPTVTAAANPIQIISGASVQLTMNFTGPIVSYNWQPSQNLSCTACPSPIANPQFSTNYTVDIVDRYGCKNSGSISVRVVCTGQNFFVPNSFSPNGDGMNDVFYLRGTGLFRVKSLRVFNRWGEIVFEKTEVPVNDPSHGWNGMYKGRKAAAGVYVYQVEIICSNGELITYSGNIALLQ